MVSALFGHIVNSFKAAVRQLIARFGTFCTPVAYLKNQDSEKLHRKMATFVAIFVALTTVMPVLGVFTYTRGSASAAANNNLNFQGRLLGSGGKSGTLMKVTAVTSSDTTKSI